MVSAILLAAGSSSRMQEQNKLLLPLWGKAIFNHTLESILKSRVKEVIVVTGYQSEAIDQLIKKNDYRVKIVHNPDFQSGMTSSIQRGIKAVDPKSEGFMICLADMPLLLPSHYDQVIKAFKEAFVKDPQTIVVPSLDGRRGNPAIFSKVYREDILHHSKQNGCKEVIEQHAVHRFKIEVETGIEMLDIDVKEDYESTLGKSRP